MGQDKSAPCVADVDLVSVAADEYGGRPRRGTPREPSASVVDLVQDGLGTPAGCTVPEQILIALSMMHDHSVQNTEVDDDLRSAVNYECKNATEEVDAHRYKELRKLLEISQSSEVEWAADIAAVPEDLKLLLI